MSDLLKNQQALAQTNATLPEIEGTSWGFSAGSKRPDALSDEIFKDCQDTDRITKSRKHIQVLQDAENNYKLGT